MRNKIKQLLKKEGGFTLVELLAVLAILALIVGIAIPMIGNVVQNSQVKADDAQIELIVDAAQLRAIEKEADFKTVTSIDIDELVKDGFMEYNEELEGGSVTITRDTNGKETYDLVKKQ